MPMESSLNDGNRVIIDPRCAVSSISSTVMCMTSLPRSAGHDTGQPDGQDLVQQPRIQSFNPLVLHLRPLIDQEVMVIVLLFPL